MRKYRFLLLAFFLSLGVHADIMRISNSSRNINELGNIKESTERAQQPSRVIPLNAQTNGVPNLGAQKGKTALSNVSCKTYEGKIYDQGEAGYNDCIRTIKTDRQKDTFVP